MCATGQICVESVWSAGSHWRKTAPVVERGRCGVRLSDCSVWTVARLFLVISRHNAVLITLSCYSGCKLSFNSCLLLVLR